MAPNGERDTRSIPWAGPRCPIYGDYRCSVKPRAFWGTVRPSRHGLLETWVVESLAPAEATQGLAAVAPMAGQRS